MCAQLLQWCPTICDLWTAAQQALLSMGFSSQEYWSGLPCPSPGDLSGPGTEPISLVSCIAGRLFTHLKVKSENYSVVSSSLQLHGLYIQSMEFSRPDYWSGWIAFPCSRGFFQPRNWTRVSCTAGRFITNWAIREAPEPPGKPQLLRLFILFQASGCFYQISPVSPILLWRPCRQIVWVQIWFYHLLVV